jgi:hypothetical protein
LVLTGLPRVGPRHSPRASWDSLLVDQAAGDLLVVASLGGCRKTPGPRATARLQACAPLLAVYDNDPAGRAGLARLQGLVPGLVATSPPAGKDVTDFAAAGGNVRAWLQGELEARGCLSAATGGELTALSDRSLKHSDNIQTTLRSN